MKERERLIELICLAKGADPETGSFTEWLADYLLTNGVIVMPRKPRPVIKDGNRFGSDVYCPSCGSNQSGQYGGAFGYAAPRYVACYSCGEYLDLSVIEDEEESKQ